MSEGPYRRRWESPGTNQPRADGRYGILLIFVVLVALAIWGLREP